MDPTERKKFRPFIITFFLCGMLFFSTITLGSRLSQKNSNDNENTSNFNTEVTPHAGFIDWSKLNLIDPEIIANESQLMGLATSGDGLSWDTAYIIENIRIEQNYTTYGLVITNISRYVIIRESVFYNFYPGNFYPGLVGTPYSLLINNSQHIRIETSFMKAISGSDTTGIRIENSSDISIYDTEFNQYSHGVKIDDSENCSISESKFDGQLKNHVWLDNSSSISIFNNVMLNLLSNRRHYWPISAIKGVNIFDCLIYGNKIDSENQVVDLFYSKNVIFSTNQLSMLVMYFVADLMFVENEINGKLYFSEAINITVRNNIIQNGIYAVEAYNMYDFLIAENTIQQITYEIFSFHYFPTEIPAHITNWFEFPEISTERIANNQIDLMLGELYKSLPLNIILSGNMIIPQDGFFIFMITSLLCISLYLRSVILYRKKVAHLRSLSQKIPEEGKDQPITNSFAMLLKMEQARIRQASYQLFIWLGLFCTFTFSENFYAGRVVQILLSLFGEDSYILDLGLRAFLTAAELRILGVVLGIITYLYLRSVDRMPKMVQTHENRISSFDWRVIAGIIGLIAILEVITMSVMIRGNFPVLALFIGILSLSGFIFNLLLIISHKTKHLHFEFLVMGVVFIIGYIFILNSINPNIVRTNNPVGVNSTVSLLSWGIFLIGGIGWLRAFFSVDLLSR